jgi:twitching motility protein PilT
VRNLVREGKTNQLRNTLVTGQSAGMVTLEMSLSQLVLDDQISYDEAVAVSLYPHEITKPTPTPVAAEPPTQAIA